MEPNCDVICFNLRIEALQKEIADWDPKKSVGESLFLRVAKLSCSINSLKIKDDRRSLDRGVCDLSLKIKDKIKKAVQSLIEKPIYFQSAMTKLDVLIFNVKLLYSSPFFQVSNSDSSDNIDFLSDTFEALQNLGKGLVMMTKGNFCCYIKDGEELLKTKAVVEFYFGRENLKKNELRKSLKASLK